MKLPKDLFDFREWCLKNTTRNLFEGIDLAITNYKKESDESRKNNVCLNCGDPIDLEFDIDVCSLSCYIIMVYD